MEEYHLRNLFVYKYNNGIFDEYLLIEYDKIHDKYTELFTGLKLQINNKKLLEPLSNYYSIMDIICNFYKGDLDSLFMKYKSINYINILSNYEQENINKYNKSLYENIIINKPKHVGIKKYYLDNLYLIKLEDGYNYICLYNELSNKYQHIFTKKYINKNMIENSIPLDKYLNIDNKNLKVSIYTLLEIYNAINLLEIYSNMKEEDIIFELQGKGLYEESKLYKKLTKK